SPPFPYTTLFRSEAEVVLLGSEPLRHAVGRGVAAIDDLGPRVDRGSGVKAGRAAAPRVVAAVAEDVELGDGPSGRGSDGVVTGCGVDVGPRRHRDAVPGRGGGSGEPPVGHVGD